MKQVGFVIEFEEPTYSGSMLGKSKEELFEDELWRHVLEWLAEQHPGILVKRVTRGVK